MTTREDVELFKKKRYKAMAGALIPELENRQFEVHYCDNGKDASDLALSLIPEGSSISWGGSATIEEIGLLDRIKTGNYDAIDRAKSGTPEERYEIMRRGLTADYFLTSFNGVSMDGTLFNIDGNGNRVAAITFGPRYVIAVVGMNKVCKTWEDALNRSEGVAAEMNAARFGREDTLFTENDVTEDVPVGGRICNIVEQIRFCGTPRRIKIILVGEELGF